MRKHLAGLGGALCRLVAGLYLHMFQLSAHGWGWGDFVATARAELAVLGEAGRQVQLARHRAVRRGKRLPLPLVLEEFAWVTVLWMVAQLNGYWMGHNFPPLPSVFQINCGGLGGGALEGEVPPHFHCMCPPVGESQVYGPSLSPADVLKDQEWGVAYGWSTGHPLCAHTEPVPKIGKTLGMARQPYFINARKLC